MNKTSKGREFAVVSAICYIIFTLYFIITDFSATFNSNPLLIAVSLLFWISLVGIIISLLFANKKAVCGATCACAFAHLFIFVILLNANTFSTVNLWGFIIYAVLSVTVFLAEKKNKTANKMSYLAGIISLISCLNYLLNFFILPAGTSQTWEREVFYIVECGALLYAGFWLKDSTDPNTSNSSVNHSK